MKKLCNFRLSDEARAILLRLAQQHAIGKTAMLEIIIRQADKKKGD